MEEEPLRLSVKTWTGLAGMRWNSEQKTVNWEWMMLPGRSTQRSQEEE